MATDRLAVPERERLTAGVEELLTNKAALDTTASAIAAVHQTDVFTAESPNEG